MTAAWTLSVSKVPVHQVTSCWILTWGRNSLPPPPTVLVNTPSQPLIYSISSLFQENVPSLCESHGDLTEGKKNLKGGIKSNNSWLNWAWHYQEKWLRSIISDCVEGGRWFRATLLTLDFKGEGKLRHGFVWKIPCGVGGWTVTQEVNITLMTFAV